MIRPLSFFLSLLCLSTVASGMGGVGVGNGQNTYVSPAAKFLVAFASDLSLTVKGDDAFEISNSKLVSEREPVSKISFHSSRGRVKTLAALKAYVARTYPARSFSPLKLKGAAGFASETYADGELDGLYVLFTTNLDLVEITVHAYAVGNGIALIQPIVRSFTYDVTPPRVDAIRVGQKVWPAGTKQKVHLHVIEENSGIRMNGFGVDFSYVDEQGKVTEPARMGGWKAVDQGNGWYTLTVDVNAWVRPGTYVLSSGGVSDLAGNSGWLSLDASGKRYEHTKLPAVHVAVTNPGPSDSTAPMLREVREDPSVWLAGETHRIFFRITDDAAGVDPSSLACGNLSPRDLKEIEFLLCKNPRAEGGDWYSLEITPNSYMPSGTYSLWEITAADKAGNRTKFTVDRDVENHDDGTYHAFLNANYTGANIPTGVPVFEVQVQNPGQSDVTGPEVFEIKFSESVWRTGETVRLSFRARDEGSGVWVGSHPDTPLGDGKFGLFLLEEAGKAGGKTLWPQTTELKSDGGGWYHADIEIDPYWEAGKFTLLDFEIHDNAGNRTQVWCDQYKQPLVCRNQNGPTVKPIYVEIVR